MVNREEILSSLQQLPGVELSVVMPDYCVIYDDKFGKISQFNFNISSEQLASKIHISDSAQKHAPMDKTKLAEYLINNVDEHAFLTLEELYIVADESDYERLAGEYQDPSVLDFFESKERGVMWFDHNVCIVDVKNIIERCKITETSNLEFRIKRRIIGVIIHELRHLMLDTTLVLPEDKYPRILGHEFRVDDYAFDVTDSSVDDWMPIFH